MNITFENVEPYYDKVNGGYGFVPKNCALPARKVELSKLFIKDEAVCIMEEDHKRFESYGENATDYDLGGMIFRVELPQGAHHIEVECIGNKDTVSIGISGMHPYRIRNYNYWDAAELIPVKNRAVWKENVWSYSFVNGLPFIDIEVEPLKQDTVVGIKAIRIQEIGLEQAQKPTIFILGDSTAKSYVFEEAPMSAWGQCFYRMVDLSAASVINYSNGGRSLKSMYIEGRFNDMLLTGKAGDFVLLQSGHNDERSRNDGIDPDGEKIRFGGGSTEEMYYQFITERFLPAIKSRGMIPVLVTPVTRMNACCADNTVFEDSFTNRKFPQVMRKAAADTETLLLDLNQRSVEYFNEIGAVAARAIVMSLEPGETPGKTNNGSYANGNPNNHADGTHYKEALSKQYCRLVAEEIYHASKKGNIVANKLFKLLTPKVKLAVETLNYSEVFPEICIDTVTGEGAYYRNQIEKLVQAGIFSKDSLGYFHPEKDYTIEEFCEAIAKLWRLPKEFTSFSGKGALRRRDAAEILYDAYLMRFGMEEDKKPKYMTDYNGTTIDINDPNYDSNIPLGETIYYPLVAFERLQDVDELPPDSYSKVEAVYRLGIMRSEEGIARGKLTNGTLFLPEVIMTRAKAAKLLYFCFVLDKDIKMENHVV